MTCVSCGAALDPGDAVCATCGQPSDVDAPVGGAPAGGEVAGAPSTRTGDATSTDGPPPSPGVASGDTTWTTDATPASGTTSPGSEPPFGAVPPGSVPPFGSSPPGSAPPHGSTPPGSETSSGATSSGSTPPPGSPPPGSPPPHGSTPPGGTPPPGWHASPASPSPRPHPSGLSSESRGWAIGAHLGGLVLGIGTVAVLGFLAPMVVWLLKRDEDAFVDHHAKEALNFQLTVLVAVLASLVLAVPAIIFGAITLGVGFVLVGLLVLAAAVAWFVLPIIGTVKASNGEGFRYPLTIRFVA
jgi:uncharacterized protein